MIFARVTGTVVCTLKDEKLTGFWPLYDAHGKPLP